MYILNTCTLYIQSGILYVCVQLYPTLYKPLDGSLPDSSVHGIFQARILEWVAISSTQGLHLTQMFRSCHFIVILLFWGGEGWLKYFSWRIIALRCCVRFCCYQVSLSFVSFVATGSVWLSWNDVPLSTFPNSMFSDTMLLVWNWPC